MGQLGTKLKQARLEQGLSLEQLNERTKIQKHHLEGIETGDYSAIPGGFYVRAFIKRYAQAVGMDGDALLREHKNELPEDEPEAVPAEHLTRRPEKKKRSSGPVAESMPKVLVALFIVFILLVIWYFYLLSTSGNDVQQEEEGGDVEYEAPAEQTKEQPEAAEEEEAPVDEPEEQPEPEEPQAQLELESVSGETTTYTFTGPADKQLEFAANGESWLTVLNDDGAELLSLARVFEAGETEAVDVSDETSVFMRVGDYAMLSIELNGETVPYEQERKPQNIIIRFDDAE
ncbi:RodZ domain-containing protein [Planococcus rifietoensis]|uniref:helix-turn-helix domain-containing protein n=1 Tax=Planococcus rifietoensis TaxID=200991 RepID=UPI00384E0FE4